MVLVAETTTTHQLGLSSHWDVDYGIDRIIPWVYSWWGSGCYGSQYADGGCASVCPPQTTLVMADRRRKLKVFSEIATASKDQIIQSRTGQATASSSSDGNSDSGPAIWQVDSSSERQGELDRERDLSATYGRIESDSQMGSDIDRPTTPGRSGVEQGKKELDVEGTIGKQTQSTWERLRSRSLGRNEPTVQAAAGRVEDERSKEQREFDEMLEKERRGVDSDTFK